MNKRVLQRHAMLKLVAEHCAKPNEVTKKCSAFIDIVNSLQIKLDAYDVACQKSIENTKALTAEKKSKRMALENHFNYVMATASVFANVDDEMLLGPNVSYTPTYVRKMRDGELVAFVRNVYSMVLPYLDGLQKYGLDAECLDKLLVLNNDFWSYLSVPKVNRNGVRCAIGEAERYIDEAMLILTSLLDPFARGIGFSDANWYFQYKFFRKQRLMGTRHTQIKISVADDCGEAISNAVVMVKYADTLIKGMTDFEGKFVLDGN